MRARTGPIAWLVYVVVRGVLTLMQMFPVDWNLCTARLAARVWIRLLPRHFQRAVEHLSAAYGDAMTRAQIEQVARRSLESQAMFAVEVACVPRLINKYNWPDRIRLVGFAEPLRLFLSGGAILVTGHYGYFELVGHLLAAFGFDVVAVMRPLDNVRLNRMVVAARRTHGLTLLDKKGAMERADALLAQGSLLGFIGDQDAGRKGIFADFFGRPASTYKSIALLAVHTGAPIVVGYARRLGCAARYEIGVQRIIRSEEWEARDDPLEWITQTYTSAIEAFVRQQPDQYLWIHRRWKTRPKATRRQVPRPGVPEAEAVDGAGVTG